MIKLHCKRIRIAYIYKKKKEEENKKWLMYASRLSMLTKQSIYKWHVTAGMSNKTDAVSDFTYIQWQEILVTYLSRFLNLLRVL